MKRKSSKNIFIAFILNLIFSAIEMIGGMFTNSISIMADSVHDFGDAISIAVSWILEKKSEKGPDKNYTYGYARFSILGAFITSMVLLSGSAIMIYNAMFRIINPESINYDGMLIIGILGLVINGLGALVTSHSEKVNEKVVSLHMLEDVLGWISVLVVSVIMKICNLPILDPILSIAITIYILIHVIKNLKIVFEVFLEKAPDNIDFSELKDKLTNDNKEIKGIHHVHLWSMDGVNAYATMHVVVKDDITRNEIVNLKKYINKKCNEFKISHITIEIEYESEKCEHEECNIQLDNKTAHIHHH